MVWSISRGKLGPGKLSLEIVCVTCSLNSHLSRSRTIQGPKKANMNSQILTHGCVACVGWPHSALSGSVPLLAGRQAHPSKLPHNPLTKLKRVRSEDATLADISGPLNGHL